MVIVQINLTYKIGSTGRIMADLNDVITLAGHQSYMVAGYSNECEVPNLYCMEPGHALTQMRKDIFISRISGKMGYRQKRETKKAIEWISSKKPDVVHLHNIHGDWINVELLFSYLKNANAQVVWTFHDCWPFTGRCAYFEKSQCMKWLTGCSDCKEKGVYPITYFFDFSKKMWQDKKKWFLGVPNLKIITPSEWLASFVKKSFLNCYQISVINNGIDLSQFQKSSYDMLLEKYPLLKGKKIVLGVAGAWSERKGLGFFFELNEILDSRFRIVLIGLNSRQLKHVPSGIIAMGKTNCVAELVQWYSCASVFVNPTLEDNYPTTNLEAQACGTPVVTFETGGSPESVYDGIVVKQKDSASLKNAIEDICCRVGEHAFDVSCFSKWVNFEKYLKIYLNE